MFGITLLQAVGAAGIFWFLSYCPYFFVFPRYADISGGGKRCASLFSNTALAMGANIITLRESTGEGLTWDNIGERLAEEDAAKAEELRKRQMEDAERIRHLEVLVLEAQETLNAARQREEERTNFRYNPCSLFLCDT